MLGTADLGFSAATAEAIFAATDEGVNRMKVRLGTLSKGGAFLTCLTRRCGQVTKRHYSDATQGAGIKGTECELELPNGELETRWLHPDVIVETLTDVRKRVA